MLAERASYRGGPEKGGELPIVLDLNHLRRFTMGQLAFEREILGLFAATLAQTIAALESAEGASEWHRAAHTLKGSALGIGAGRLAGLAREAEQIGALTPSDRGPIMDRIRSAASELLEEARRHNLL